MIRSYSQLQIHLMPLPRQDWSGLTLIQLCLVAWMIDIGIILQGNCI